MHHRPGAIAEAAVRLALLEAGLRVLVPVGDDEPYDLVVHAPTRNNQAAGVRLAEDFTLERWATSLARR